MSNMAPACILVKSHKFATRNVLKTLGFKDLAIFFDGHKRVSTFSCNSATCLKCAHVLFRFVTFKDCFTTLKNVS